MTYVEETSTSALETSPVKFSGMKSEQVILRSLQPIYQELGGDPSERPATDAIALF
jgi:hypothetical protein